MGSTLTTCLATALLMLGSATASAQTFYVAETGVDQSGGGTLANPWASIGFATNNVPDGAVIEVLPGTYNGRSRLNGQFQNGITVRSSEPYQAQLRHDGGAALICFTCQGITVEGFDIAHAAGNTGGLVVQIQDLLGDVAGSDNGTDAVVSNIVLHNNIIHDSTNNDLLKINNGVERVRVAGNIFYNQAGSDEHIDINSTVGVVVEDNVFFNSTTQTNTSSFVVIKDSNGQDDTVLGTRDTMLRRNVFLNWQGSSGQGFIRVGEDSTEYFEADGVLIENNLLIGNSSTLMRSAFTVQGSRDVTFRNNTITGDLPARSYAGRFFIFGSNQPSQDLVLANNIWSDTTGSMGSEALVAADIFEAAEDAFVTAELNNNLYYNGAAPVPTDPSQALNLGDDASALQQDPLIPAVTDVALPVWDGTRFAGGETSIREVFVNLVTSYGEPLDTSPVVDAADPANAPATDILMRRRSSAPDIGAIEVNPSIDDLVFADGFEPLKHIGGTHNRQ